MSAAAPPRPTPEPSRARAQAEHAVWGAVRLLMRATRDPIGQVLDRRVHADDPYAAYRSIRERGPVVAGRFPLTYVTADHAVASDVLKRQHVGMAEAIEPKPWQGWTEWDSPLSPSLLDLDPPDHTRIRRLVAQAFTPRAIAQLRDRARTVATELLDAVHGRDEVDLVAAFAQPLPITMICAMLGVPDDDHASFVQWGGDIALSLEPRQTPEEGRRVRRSGDAIAAFFHQHFEERRRRLERGDAPEDVLTNLLRATEDGVGLTERELTATCILLLGAGFETTVNLLGNAVLALSRNPEQQAHLVAAGPEAMPNAVEEFLRHDAPVQFTGRMTWDDDVIGGEEIPPGATILTLLGGANRDPAVFAEPDTLDVTRPNAREHLSFSLGPHHCLGAALARLEAEVALELLLERHPNVRHVAPARRRATTVLRGLETLPVALG